MSQNLGFESVLQEEEVIEKFMQLIKNLDESGIIDVLTAATDPEGMKRLVQILITPGTMKLVDNIDVLLNLLGDISKALSEPVEPVSLFTFMRKLGDKEVGRGLARLLAILKILGKE